MMKEFLSFTQIDSNNLNNTFSDTYKLIEFDAIKDTVQNKWDKEFSEIMAIKKKMIRNKKKKKF